MSNYNTLKTADTINTVSIVDGAITTSKLGASVTTLIVAGGGPKVTAITYPGNDLAADPAGGQTITLTGTGFVSGCSVFVGTVQASVVTVVNATSVTFTAPALAAATYTLYLVNPDGGTATIVPGISYSGTPTWSTAAGTLGSAYEYSAVNNTVAATGDGSISYSVFSGTLPTGSSLNTSTGVISGTSPASAGATTYTFVIRATDAQLQDTDRSFSITVNTDVVTWSTPANNSTVTLGKDVASSTALSATSAAGNAITYTANTLPAGLSISGATVTGAPTVPGTTATTFTATAATTGKTATAVINWTVSVAADTYFPYTTLLLSGAAATETFIADASVNNFAVTIAGDTKPNNFNPYTPGYYSVYSNNTGVLSNVTTTTISAGVFTFEGWFNLTAVTALTYLMGLGTNTGGSTPYFNVSLTSSGTVINVECYGTVTSAFIFNANYTWPLNRWVHLAAVGNGTTVKVYVNGVGLTTTLGSGTFPGSYLNTLSLYPWVVGILFGGGGARSDGVNGYVSNFRFVNGIAVYTADFTPSTTPLTAISGTAMLACQSNRLINSNNVSLTTAGSTSVKSFTPFVPNTAYAAYGSTYFDGTGDYLTLLTNPPTYAYKSGNFCLECWHYMPTAFSGYQYLVSFWHSAPYKVVILGYDGSTTAGRPTFYWTTDGSTDKIITASNAVPINQWNHIAVMRTANTISLFVNGVRVATASESGTLNSTGPTGWSTIMAHNAGAEALTPGYLYGLRSVIGSNPYDATLTTLAVPTAPLTAITNTSLLTCQTNQPVNNSVFLDSSTNAFAVTRAGNTSAGTFTPYGANWSNYFNGSSYMVPATGINAAMGTGFAGNIISFEMWIFPTDFNSSSYNQGLASAYAAVSNSSRWGITLTKTAASTTSFTFLNTDSVSSEVYATTTTSPITLNQWHHIVVTIDATTAASSTIKLFANGVLLNTFTGRNLSMQTAYYRAVVIGGANSQYMSEFFGYISNFRILKGAFAYTGNYTVPTAPLTAIANTVLLTCQSNSFVDNSANAFALSLTGTPTVQRFSPFSPQTQTAITHSAYYGTKTDYISIPATTALTTFTGDFTFECWVNPTDTSISTNWGIWDSRQNGQTASAMIFTLQNLASPVTGQWRLSYYYGSGTQTYGTGIVLANQWTHVAFVRSGSTLTYYVNGVAGGTATVSGTQTGSATSNPVYIGTKDGSLSGYGTVGYISNFRIVKDVAVYTGNFTVPTAPLSATQSSGTNIAAITGTATSLLTLQSPTLIDASTNAYVLTPATTTVKPRTVNPFGFTNTLAAYSAATYGGNAYYDGTEDYLTTVATGLVPATNPFTIECWVYSTSYGDRGIVAQSAGGAGRLIISINSSGNVNFQIGGTTLTTTGYTIGLNQWTHIALTRVVSTVTVYFNGVSVATGANATSVDNVIVTIGRVPTFSQYWSGNISNLRIVNGVAVYTSNFVPPTAPLTAITNTSLLLNMTSAGIYDAASINNLETVADAKILSTQTPYAGSFYSNYFAANEQLTSTTIGTSIGTSDFSMECWVYVPVAANSYAAAIQLNVSTGYNLYIQTHLSTLRVLDYNNPAGSNFQLIGGTINNNTWYHLLLTRQSGTVRGFIDGKLTVNQTAVTFNYGTAGTCQINAGLFAANISNARVILGNVPAAYQTSSTTNGTQIFTPSTIPLTAVSGTALLTCQSNRFIDNSTNAFTIAVTGNASVQSFNPFQRNSATTMSFDGTGDWLFGSPSVQNQLTGNFTIECWAYPTTLGSQMGIVTITATSASGTNGLAIYFDTSNKISFWVNGNGGTAVTTTAYTANQWYHIALVRNGTTNTLYVNGVSSASNSVTPTWPTTPAIGIGRIYNDNSSYSMTGYINDLRITKGIARYTATFTPPTTAFITK